jgi:hypothetical protein
MLYNQIFKLFILFFNVIIFCYFIDNDNLIIIFYQIILFQKNFSDLNLLKKIFKNA